MLKDVEPSIKKRQRLGLAVRVMLTLLVLAFLFIFFRGLGDASVSGPDAEEEMSVTLALSLGQTGLRRHEGRRVWVTRISKAQRLEANTIAKHLFSSDEGCAIVSEFCVLNAATDQPGVELSFTEQTPVQVPSQVPWFGGFVNPITGAVYDRFGRAYKLSEVAPASLQVIDLN